MNASKILSKLKSQDKVLEFKRKHSTEYIFYEPYTWYGIVILDEEITDTGEYDSESVPISRANDCMNEDQEYFFWDKDKFMQMIGHKTATEKLNLEM